MSHRSREENMEEVREGQGFKVRDRRIFSQEKAEEEVHEPREQRGQRQAEGPKAPRDVPLPEPTFSAFLTFFFFQQALMFLGEIPHAETRQLEKNLPMAKYLIDTLAMIREKTKGNLTQEEQGQLDAFLTELRMRYVKAVGG